MDITMLQNRDERSPGDSPRFAYKGTYIERQSFLAV